MIEPFYKTVVLHKAALQKAVLRKMITSEMNRHMRSFGRVFIGTVMFAAAFSNVALADQKFSLSGGATSLPPTQTQSNDNTSSNGNNSRTPDCTRPNTDPRCKPVQPPDNYPPHYDSHPHRPRPVIINQLPPQPAIEIDTLTDDWTGCRKAKLGSIHARNTGDSDQANHLDDWLWKNCRTYSNELRQLEQNDM